MSRRWTITALVILAGCAGTGEVQSRLRSRSGPLMYLHDLPTQANSDVDAGKRRTVVLAPIVAQDAIPPSTTVVRTESVVVPLLLVNFWKHQFRTELGAREISSELGEFIRDSLVRELARRSALVVVEEDGDVHVQVRLTSIEVSAPVVRSGGLVLLPWVMSGGSSLESGPAHAAVRAELVAAGSGGGFRVEVEGTRDVVPLGGRAATFEDQTIAMIEALSLAVKDLNSAIAQRLEEHCPIVGSHLGLTSAGSGPETPTAQIEVLGETKGKLVATRTAGTTRSRRRAGGSALAASRTCAAASSTRSRPRRTPRRGPWTSSSTSIGSSAPRSTPISSARPSTSG